MSAANCTKRACDPAAKPKSVNALSSQAFAPVLPSAGSGPYRHDDPHDRPACIFGGRTTLHVDPSRAPDVLVPITPEA